jgi:hypothetical protein
MIMGNFTQERLDQIWDKGQTIRGKAPDLYCKDIYGNTVYKHSYGKTSEMSWNLDHSKSQAEGDTDHLNNLQPNVKDRLMLKFTKINFVYQQTHIFNIFLILSQKTLLPLY